MGSAEATGAMKKSGFVHFGRSLRFWGYLIARHGFSGGGHQVGLVRTAERVSIIHVIVTGLSLSKKWKATARFRLRRAIADDQVRREGAVGAEGTKLLEALSFDDLILPGNRDTTSWEFAVEGVVTGVDVDTFHSGKLLNIQCPVD